MLTYVVVTLQLLSPVSLLYGCWLNVSVDSIVDVYPLTRTCLIVCVSSLVYILDEVV